jgi:hypothetical protein
LSAKSVGFKVTRDGGLIVHPDYVVTGDNNTSDDLRSAVDISSQSGAGFGQPISDADLAFAACREPVAHFLTYGVAGDVTDKWFYIDDTDTKTPDTQFDQTIQTVLTSLDFRAVLTEAIVQARIYRKCLIVAAFSDAKTVADLKKPKKAKAELLQFETYPKTENGQKLNVYAVDQKDDNINSLRYGKPLVYRVDQGGGNILYVHYTRCVEVDNRFSVLAPVYDDLVCGRNIRWGAAQWLYRTGGGFPVLGFPRGTSIAQLEAYCTSGAFSNLMSRSYITLAQNSKDENDGMTLEFKGAAGPTLDPQPFFKSNLEQIAIATGIPQAKLVGAQAGAVTGSDVNMQDYFKVISRIQNGEPTRIIRQVIRWLAESNQIPHLQVSSDNKDKETAVGDFRRRTVHNYEVVWNSAFELSEVDKAKIALDNARANQIKLDYMTIDEVRGEEDLEPLPDNEGAKLKGSGLSELFQAPATSTNTTTEEGAGETPSQQLQAADKFLLIDLKPKPQQRHKHAS